ncbi:MAG: type 4a pilus biogenesis protein PilO [Deltaproteobacteria bacterium]|nr:type 4a pilus biogenesis protein PilO [Candidatus Anaeroferrophillus wilburensis]MBN2888099.1 type 4a pilus biogenesis protein PilO [Deltaproteobacteria bacterium]
MADLNLDFLQRLSNPKKILLVAVIAIGIGGLYYYFLFGPQLKQLTKLNKQYQQAQLKLSQTKQIANQLEKFEKEIAGLQMDFKMTAQKLPNSKEIPRLLMQITKLGKEAGLDFELFQPQSAKPVGFYAEVPIDIAVTGNYHALGTFFTNICTMSRIVSIDDYQMSDYKVINGQDTLSTKFKAITYTFIEQPKGGENHGS